MRKTQRSSEWFFSRPILEALLELGGGAECSTVLDLVYQKTAAYLTPEDRAHVDSSLEPRWRNTAKWERNRLVKNGFLKKSKVRGFWEISPAGIEHLEWMNEMRDQIDLI